MNSSSSSLKRLFHYLSVIALVAAAVGPFLWLAMTALKGPEENIFAYPPQWLPQSPTLAHFKEVLEKIPFLSYLLNSLGAALVTIILNLVISVLGAYPLARFRFPGRKLIFYLVLATMMIPFQVLMIPLYLKALAYGLTESNGPLATWIGLSLPFAVSGFGIFFVRQAFLTLPNDLDEAAALDGASPWQCLWFVLIPLIKPTLATLAIFTLMASWGEFLWPSILLSNEMSFTLPVGLVQLQGQFSANWRLIAAGTLMAMLPAMLFFLVMQRYFLKGSLGGAVKG